MTRHSSRPRTHANARTPKPRPDAQDVAQRRAHFAQMMPKGTRIYGVLRSQAASGTRTIAFFYVSNERTIERVPPNAGILAGVRYNPKKDGFVFTGGGYSAVQEMAEALGRLLHGNERAIEYETYYL